MRTDPLSRATHRVRGFKTWQVVGVCDVVSSSGWKVLGPLGLTAPTLPTSAGTLSLVSNNAADNSTKVCQVVYLDDNWLERVATYQLNGTTPVTNSVDGTILARRVKSIRCRSSNTGVLTASIAGNVQMGVAAGAKVSRSAILPTPAGQKTWIHSVKFWAQTSKPAQLRVRVDVPGETGWVELFRWPARETATVDAYVVPRVLEDVQVNGDWVEAGITFIAEVLGGEVASSTATIMFECEAERTTDALAAGFRT